MRRWLWAILCLTCVARAEAKPYTLADLEALEQRGAWRELINHLEDIPPAKRDAKWDALCERASAGALDDEEKRDGRYAVAIAEALLERYPSLEKSEKFMLRAAKITRLHGSSAFAASHFATAIDLMPENRRQTVCKDEQLALATIAALGLPADDRLVARGRALAKTCLDALEPALKEELGRNQKGSYFFDNACGLLLERGALSSLQAKQCARVEKERSTARSR